MEAITVGELLSSIIVCMGLGTAIGLIVIGIVMYTDRSYTRLKRAKKKYKEENKQYNK